MAGKHSPNRFASYQEVHETVMAQLRRGGFVVSDDLVFTPLRHSVLLEGTIRCLGDLYINVRKQLAIREGHGATALVQTVYYSYNVVLSGVGNVFRYDSPHPTHNEEHHVHRYDVLEGDQEGTVTFILEEDQRPTLGEVIHEAEAWYYNHYDRLGANG